MLAMVERPSDPMAATSLTKDELVRKYRLNYGLDEKIGLAEVTKHVDLEHSLTSLLLQSKPEDRWECFSSAYTRLYEELPWLAGTGSKSQYEIWSQLLKPESRILEIGSGAGQLLKDLSSHGFTCVATEISKERGEKFVDGVTWRVSDGVHLDKFEAPGTFDHVISDNVVEHLHPDDIVAHFESARHVLRDGGSYIVKTPHRSAGPADLSRVLGFDEAVFMHLHEFRYGEFERISREAGYSSIKAVLQIPKLRIVRSSETFYRFMLKVDAIESRLTATQAARRRFRAMTKWIFAPKNVWVELRK